MVRLPRFRSHACEVPLYAIGRNASLMMPFVWSFLYFPLTYVSHRQDRLRDDFRVFVIRYRHSLDPGIFVAYLKLFQPISPNIRRAQLLLVSFVATMYHHFPDPLFELCNCSLEGFLFVELAYKT